MNTAPNGRIPARRILKQIKSFMKQIWWYSFSFNSNKRYMSFNTTGSCEGTHLCERSSSQTANTNLIWFRFLFLLKHINITRLFYMHIKIQTTAKWP